MNHFLFHSSVETAKVSIVEKFRVQDTPLAIIVCILSRITQSSMHFGKFSRTGQFRHGLLMRLPISKSNLYE